MTIANVLYELQYVSSGFPRDAVTAAQADPDAITPHLLAALSGGPAAVAERGDAYMLHLYAFYLLAEFRCAAALPAVVSFFDAADEAALEVTDDFVTQDLGRVLASLCLGRPATIQAMIENASLNEWTRAAALHGWVALYNTGQITREVLVTYFGALLDGRLQPDTGAWWNALADVCCTAHTPELLPALKQAFADGRMIADRITLAEVRHELARDLPTGELVRQPGLHVLIDDTVAELHNWACFREPEVTRPVPPSNRQVGRNEPCPCGSGRKYKKCCLGRPVASASDEVFDMSHQTAAVSASGCPAIDACFNRAFQYLAVADAPDTCREFALGWSLLRQRLTPAMTSLQDIPRRLGSVFYPEDITHEYIMALDGYGRDKPAEAAAGIAFCEFIVGQFTGEDDHFQENMQGYLGALHFLNGDPEQGEAVLQALITARPHRSVGYAYLSDQLACDSFVWHPDGPLDLPRAAAVLREALALPVEDAADYDLELRLEDIEL